MPIPKIQFAVSSQEHSTGVGVSSLATALNLDPPNQNLESHYGRFYAVAVIHSPDMHLGKEVRSVIEQKYYDEELQSPFNSLSSLCGEVVHLLNQRQIATELACASIVDNVAYL